MPFFSSTVEAILAGRLVSRTRLVKFEFTSQTICLHEGMGALRTADGTTWYGSGELGQIGDVESPLGDAAPQVTFTLSGVDPQLLTEALNASDEVKGKPVTVYMQFLNNDTGALLDSPYAIFVGTMDTMKVSKTDVATRTVTLTAETLFTARGFPPFGWLSDRDQKRLWPGDRGLEQVASMLNKSIAWPQYIILFFLSSIISFPNFIC